MYSIMHCSTQNEALMEDKGAESKELLYFISIQYLLKYDPSCIIFPITLNKLTILDMQVF